MLLATTYDSAWNGVGRLIAQCRSEYLCHLRNANVS